MDEFKLAQRAVWAAGDYPALSKRIADLGRRLVARAGVGPGMRVLDVGCGDGNATLPAAEAGADVTGLDLVPELLAAGRAQAGAAGLDVEWLEGDAEDLPFEDGSFDRVLSCIGHMFAPRHRVAADEMARVCRDGGVIAFIAWTPEGTVGELFKLTASYMPPPPDYASPPILWGTEEHVREMFGGVASDVEFERDAVWIDAESVVAWGEVFFDTFGPMVTARQRLGDRFEELRGRILELWEGANEAPDGRLRFPQEYLLSVVRL